MRFIKYIILGCLLIATNGSLWAQNLTARQLFSYMLVSMDKMKGAKYTFLSKERVKNKVVEGEVKIKVSLNPTKLYLNGVKPNKGLEVLYVYGVNDNLAKVNTHGFPFINLNLDPMGSLIRGNQHHTVRDAGFSYLSRNMKGYLTALGENFYKFLSLGAIVTYKGRQFYQLIIEDENFGTTSYLVKKGETMTTIAEKLHVSDYMILEMNPSCDFYDDIKEGQTIKVPTAYAKRLVFYVDKTTYLPLVQIIEDDKGIYERYEMDNFQLNPTFAPDEFTPSFKEYKF